MAPASILIPAFNPAELVLRTIESLRAQTLEDITIMINNCVTDGTCEAAQACVSQDPRIRVYRNETNIRRVRNWRRYAELATSTHCKLLFSDDLIAPTFRKKNIPHLIGNKTAFAHTPVTCGEAAWTGASTYRAFQSECKFIREFFLRSAMPLNYFPPASPGGTVFRKTELLNSLLDSFPGVEGHDFSGKKRRRRPVKLPQQSTAIRACRVRRQTSCIYQGSYGIDKLRCAHPPRILARKAMALGTC